MFWFGPVARIQAMLRWILSANLEPVDVVTSPEALLMRYSSLYLTIG